MNHIISAAHAGQCKRDMTVYMHAAVYLYDLYTDRVHHIRSIVSTTLVRHCNSQSILASLTTACKKHGNQCTNSKMYKPPHRLTSHGQSTRPLDNIVLYTLIYYTKVYNLSSFRGVIIRFWAVNSSYVVAQQDLQIWYLSSPNLSMSFF